MRRLLALLLVLALLAGAEVRAGGLPADTAPAPLSDEVKGLGGNG